MGWKDRLLERGVQRRLAGSATHRSHGVSCCPLAWTRGHGWGGQPDHWGRIRKAKSTWEEGDGFGSPGPASRSMSPIGKGC